MMTNPDHRIIHLGGYEIKQRISDGFIDIEHFFNQYKEQHPEDTKSFEEALIDFFADYQNFKLN